MKQDGFLQNAILLYFYFSHYAKFYFKHDSKQVTNVEIDSMLESYAEKCNGLCKNLIINRKRAV